MSTEKEVWIDYFNSKDDPPTSGYIEFIDTFEPSKRYMMDANISDIEAQLWWCRGAPLCISKYRFVTEKDYLKWQLEELSMCRAALQKEVDRTQAEMQEIKSRLDELT